MQKAILFATIAVWSYIVIGVVLPDGPDYGCTTILTPAKMTWLLLFLPVAMTALGLFIYGLLGLIDYRKQCIPRLKRASYWFAISPGAFVTAAIVTSIIFGNDGT